MNDMNSVINQTKITIALKKKQIEENRQFINKSIFDLNDKVRQNYELQRDIENLDSDLYSIEKQNSVAKVSMPTSDGCMISDKNVSRG